MILQVRFARGSINLVHASVQEPIPSALLDRPMAMQALLSSFTRAQEHCSIPNLFSYGGWCCRCWHVCWCCSWWRCCQCWCFNTECLHLSGYGGWCRLLQQPLARRSPFPLFVARRGSDSNHNWDYTYRSVLFSQTIWRARAGRWPTTAAASLSTNGSPPYFTRCAAPEIPHRPPL